MTLPIPSCPSCSASSPDITWRGGSPPHGPDRWQCSCGHEWETPPAAKLRGTARFPSYPLADVVPLKAARPGAVRVLLMCGCGFPADLTFDASATGETGRSYTCEGCGSSHWFKVGEDGSDDD